MSDFAGYYDINLNLSNNTSVARILWAGSLSDALKKGIEGATLNGRQIESIEVKPEYQDDNYYGYGY